jgi:hypothetical protein
MIGLLVNESLSRVACLGAENKPPVGMWVILVSTERLELIPGNGKSIEGKFANPQDSSQIGLF